MTNQQSLPVEEARKKFADVLDSSQFRSTHTEITRRGNPAGYVVPPEWYEAAVEALADTRRRPAPSTPPAVATPRQQVTQAVPEHAAPPEWLDLTPEVAALSYERARKLFTTAESAHMSWGIEQRRELEHVPSGWRFHAGVQAGINAGLIDLADATEES